MHGSLWIEKNKSLRAKLASSEQVRGLTISIATGIIAGLLLTHIRLHLGMPGHIAVIWMTPVIIARLLGKCKAGTTAGALTASLTALLLGGRFAGPFIIGLPLVGVAGGLIDVTVSWIERKKPTLLLAIPFIGLTAMGANLICLLKRLLAPAGIGSHTAWGISTAWFQPVSYAFFGLVAGLLAGTIALLILSHQEKSRQ